MVDQSARLMEKGTRQFTRRAAAVITHCVFSSKVLQQVHCVLNTDASGLWYFLKSEGLELWSAQPQLACIYSESYERGIYVEKKSLNLQRMEVCTFTPCSASCYRGESGFWKSYDRRRIKRLKAFALQWSILHAESCTQRYIMRVAVALDHFMKMHFAHRLVRCIFGSGEGT
jgi:hypothetical protein